MKWLFPEVRDSEVQRFRYFLGLAALLLAGQAVAMTVCESLLLSRLGVTSLPAGVLLASALTIAASALYAHTLGKVRHETMMIGLLAVSLLVVLGSIPLVQAGSPLAYYGLFAYHCLTFTLFTTHFDTLSGGFFDTLSAKRLMPLLGVGATLGEISGGLLSSALTRFISTPSLLYVWAFLLVLAALYVAAGRGRLRTWSPQTGLGSPSATTVSPRFSGTAFLKRSPFARVMALSTIGMVICMSLVQYVVSDVFVKAFPVEEQLAAFLGVMLAVTNVLELVIGSRVTPWLIRRFGVARCHFIHPLGAVLTLGLLQVNYALLPGILAWANRKMIHDALAKPVRTLLFNAFPAWAKGGLRGFLQGVVGASARATAGVGLLLFQTSVSMNTLVRVGLGFGLVYLVAAALVRRGYLSTLVEGLAQGRLQLEGSPAGLELETRWKALLSSAQLPSLQRLAPLAAQTGRWDLLEQGSTHRHPEIRKVCLRHLGRRLPLRLLDDPNPDVRLETARALWTEPERLRSLTTDEDERVRRMALAALGEMPFAEMEPEQIEYACAQYLPEIREGLEQAGPERLAASLRRLKGESLTLDLRWIGHQIGHRDQRVAQAALDLLGTSSDPMATVLLCRALEDSRGPVRRRACHLLGRRGERCLPHLEPYLRAEREDTVESAYDAVAQSQAPRAERVLGQELRVLVRAAWRHILLARAVRASAFPVGGEILALALEDYSERCQRLSYRILALLEGEHVVGPVVSTLRFSRSGVRANALEVLSNLGDREATSLLVLLTEPGPIEEKLDVVARTAPALARVPQDRALLLEACAHTSGRFVRQAAIAASEEGENPELRRLKELKVCPLFAPLSFEQLAAVQTELVTERFRADERVLTAGVPCDRIYLLMDGEVEGRESILGETPALDGGPALGDIRTLTDCRFWSLEASRLKDLVKRYPGLAFPLMRRLSQKLKLATG